jgi:cytochrome b561
MEILRSGALSSFGAAVGLLIVARIVSRSSETPPLPDQPVSRHLAWILAAAAACLYYVTILGPGILMYLGN